MLTRVWTSHVRPEWKLTVAGSAAQPSSRSLVEAPDETLVAACVAGDRDAFDVIVERHRRQVYLLCYRFVGNHEDASDLSQDVFVRAYKGLQRFRGQSSLGTWIYRIGVNVCLNRVSVKRPINEPIEKHQHVDDRNESPSDRMLRG